MLQSSFRHCDTSATCKHIKQEFIFSVPYAYPHQYLLYLAVQHHAHKLLDNILVTLLDVLFKLHEQIKGMCSLTKNKIFLGLLLFDS